MKKILTISVAAYNVENYIKETLDSILESKYKDEIEIIITNDGSKDNSGSIISNYKEKYPNIINYIDQENNGAGSTVNNGIRKATGEYFKMVDGDDWVITENLDKLIEYLKEGDVDAVVSNFEYYYELDKSFKKGPSYCINNREIYDFEKVCMEMDVATSTVTYRTKLLQDNNIEVSKRFYSDYQFQVYPVPFIQTISYLDIETYVYRIGREGQSVSVKGYQNHIVDHQNVMYQLIDYYEKNKDICEPNKKSYILKKISTFINVDLSVLLSFKTCKENKNKIINTINNIEKRSKDIYTLCLNGNISSKLVSSKFRLYTILSLLKRIKNK